MGREARANQRPPELLQRIGEAVGHILDGAAVTLVVTRREVRGGPGPAASGIFATHAYTAWGAQVQDLPEESRNAVAQHHLEVSAKTLQKQLEVLRESIEAQAKPEAPEPAEGEEAAHE